MPKKRKNSPKPGLPGRPTKFTERIALRIMELASEGKTDEQIASAMGISPSTLYLWKSKDGSFSEALQRSKEVVNDMVESALLQKATGYRCRAIKVHYDSELKEFVTHEIEEQYAPDTAAATFWLKNRRPKKWREKSEVNVAVGLEDLILQSAKKETDGENHD